MKSLAEFLETARLHLTAIPDDPFMRLVLRHRGVSYCGPAEFRDMIDDPSSTVRHSVLLWPSRAGPAFDHVAPAKWLSDNVLLDGVDLESATAALFTDLCDSDEFLKQSEIPNRIRDEVAAARPDVVCLVVLDGFGWSAWTDRTRAVPCLVDGFTETESSFRRLFADPPLALRLHDLGFTTRLGVTYWDDSNPLTRHSFRGFSAGEIVTVRGIGDALPRLASLGRGTYAQLVRTGLDQYLHRHRDEPPLPALVASVERDVADIVLALQETALSVLFFLTADHGILSCPAAPQPAHALGASAGGPMRYYRLGEEIPQAARQSGVLLDVDGVLALPWGLLRRAPSPLEWGCHGGISYSESFVPFVVQSL